jgi:malate synthase
MEDAATAEISRSQIWQWIRSAKGELADGRKVTLELFRTLLGEELRKVSGAHGAQGAKYDEAAWLLDRLVADDEFVDFLTDPAYELIPSPSWERVASY